MTRLEIESQYDVENGVITSLGKFEGEPIYAPFFHEISLEAGAEAEELEFMEDGVGEYVNLIQVNSEDREEFPEISPDTTHILFIENDQGFVSCDELTNDEANALRNQYK